MKKAISLITLVLYVFVALSLPVAADEPAGKFLPKMYFNGDFDTVHNFSSTSLSSTTLSVSGGKAVFKLATGKKSSDYADVTFAAVSVESEYIVEVDVTPVSIGNGCTFKLFDAKNSSGTWRKGGTFENNGKITAYDASSGSYVQVGNWSANQTYTISYVYHMDNSTYDVYINRALAKASIKCADIIAQTIRVDISASSLLASWCKGMEIHLDNYRVYSGTEFIGSDYSPATYASNNFDYSLGMNVVRSGGEVEIADVSGNNMAHFHTEQGEASSTFADLNVPLISGIDDYVAEADITVNSMDSGSYINIFDTKDSNGKWRLGMRLESNGIYARDKNSGFLGIGNFTKGTTVRLSLVYHISSGTYDAYINAKLCKKDIECNPVRGYIFRIDMINQGGGKIDFYVDNLRAYSGSVLMSDSHFTNFSSAIMNQENGIRKILGNAGAYSVDAPYYHQNGEKHSYASFDVIPVDENGEAYVSERFLSEVMNLSNAADLVGNSTDAISINSVKCIRASEAAEKTGKKYLYDKRGFFIISDEVFPHVDSPEFIEMFEVADYIYRYLCFANPTGSEFLEDFFGNTPKGTHPRLVYNDDDIAHIKSQMSKSTWWEGRVNNIINSANTYLTTYGGTFTATCADSEKQTQAKSFQAAMENLSTAYLITGDSAYAQKAVEFMKILASWETLGWQTSNLTTGHWAMGMAIGYDSFYDYMSLTQSGKEDLEYIKDAIVRLAFADTISAYSGNGGPRWITIRDNFMGVIGGGMISLVLALADEDDIRTEIEYLADNIIKSLEIATSLYYPDGGYFEGITYSAYMLENLSLGMEALWKCCGTDYDLGNAKGFSKAGAFFAYMQTKNGSFNFHDAGSGFVRSKIPYWLAYRYGETEIAKLWFEQCNLYSSVFDLASVFFADKGIDCTGDASGASLDYYFDVTDAGSFRSDFSYADATFVGFHGGRTGLTHDMLDLGEFVFEANGVNWAIDLGADSYSLKNYFSDDGYKIYRKNPEGENCLVINPADNMNPDGTMNWYGQKIGAYAPLVLMESAPRGAMAAYDLTEAYERDVNSYTRGYYFGDDRKTLLVQDELNLKSTSELYWFMHTQATIEILDATTARLSRNGKTLIAKLYCSEEGYEFREMEAKPLPTSPDVSGQAVNTYAKKLAVHIPGATGDVQIAVKLCPETGAYTPSELTNQKIREWTLPDGEIYSGSKIYNINVSGINDFSADVLLCGEAESAKLYIDDKFICDVNPAGSLEFKISGVDFNGFDDGVHLARLDVVYSDGTTESIYETFTADVYKKKTFYANNLLDFDGGSIRTPTGWNLSKTGSSTRSSDGFVLYSTSDTKTIWLDYRTGSDARTFSGDKMIVEFDVKFSTTTGNFVVECKNSGGTWFMHGIKIFNNGKFADGTAYEADKTYHVEIILDSAMKKGYVYIDDRLVVQTNSVPTPLDLVLLKFQHTATEENSRVTYSNLELFELKNDDMPVSVDVQKKSSSEMLVTVDPGDAASSCMVAVAHYNGDSLVSVETFMADLKPENTFDIPENAQYSKVFAIDGLKPLAMPNYFKIK